ncbi:zf-HC2 domain-containing protein [Halobacillus sp. Marseille-Q1614]|uniref:zf-HC2 domain-containing protein n=1 Tax=Halobacillus sp. Marseille-Q1614 TaxID=2709134 RepID=UPI00156E4884|nr:zf-HC2 domain-containing protein [Halobacillus sp. Marseille-Q1614]
MIHVTEEKMFAYIEDELPEDDRLLVEGHIDKCSQCFDSYLDAVDRLNTSYELSPSFTDDIIDVIKEHTPKKAGKARGTLFNYAIASSMTLLLMGSGVFQYVFSTFDDQQFQEQPSITEKLLNETDRWRNDDQRGGVWHE